VSGFTEGALGAASAGNEDVFVAKVVPEPGTTALLLASAVPFLTRRRRGAGAGSRA